MTRTAAAIAHWWKATGARLPAQTRATGDAFAGDVPAMVEFLIDGVWTDMVTLGLVLDRDKINLRYGQSSEAANADPATCNFTLKNLDADFSFLNPESPYWGKVDRGTRIRISVPLGNDKGYRFHGELAGVTDNSDISGTDLSVSFEAAGYLRSAGQGDQVLDSPIFRETMNFTNIHTLENTRLLAYWPMEDASGSTTLAPAVGTKPMTFTGSPSLGGYDGFKCSGALPSVLGSTMTARPDSYTLANYNSVGSATGDHGVEVNFLLSAPSGITAANTIMKIRANGLDAAVDWKLSYPSTDHLQLRVYDLDGSLLQDSGSQAASIVGILNQVRIRMRYDHGTGDMDVEVHLYNCTTGDHSIPIAITVSGGTPGRFTQIVLNEPTVTAVDYYVGHLTLREIMPDSLTLNPVVYDSLNAYLGEEADVRFARLCGEEAITHEVITTGGTVTVDDFENGSTPDGVTMGYQSQNTILELLRECEASDGGIIYEPRQFFGMGYRTRRSMLNQDVALTLSHSGHNLVDSVKPYKDDTYVRNRWTVTRDGGSSSTQEISTGKMSVLPSPAGIGPRPDSTTLSLETDAQAATEASWRVHVSSVNEPRFPELDLNLAHSTMQGVIRNTVLEVKHGDRVVITDLPQRLGPDDLSQLALGWTEQIDKFQHTITLNTSPESPYRSGVLNSSTKPRVGTDGSYLVNGLNPTETSLSVRTQTGSAVWADSATYASDFPFDIKVNGEIMTVTAITGTSSPQTFTVTRSINGVVRSHDNNSSVALAVPTYVGM